MGVNVPRRITGNARFGRFDETDGQASLIDIAGKT